MANYVGTQYIQKLETIKKLVSALQIKIINGDNSNEIEQANKIIKLFQDINLLETEMPVCPVENDSGITSIELDSEQAANQYQEPEENTEMVSDPLASHTAQLLNNSYISYESYISTRKYNVIS